MLESEKELELYKVLKSEYLQYVQMSSTMWKFKIIAVGAAISSTIIRPEHINIVNNDSAIAFFIMAIPMISIIPDFVIMGAGAHLKVISSFIESNLGELEIMGRWEKYTWDSGVLTRLRSFLTFLCSVGVTLILNVFCTCVVFFVLELDISTATKRVYMTWGILSTIAFTSLIFWLIRQMYQQQQNANNTD